MIKIGILGMGGMGWFHASRIAKIPGAQLVAIADIRPERLAAERAVAINIANPDTPLDLAEVARYPNASRLIAEADVTVIDVCLPSFLHARYAVEALQAGKHVLCEKPMALSVADADQMLAISHQAGRKLMIAQCIRFWPEYRFLQRCLQDGSMGKLISLNMSRISGRPIWSWDNWMLDESRSGGVLHDLHIHDVDFVNYLLGMPATLHATRRTSNPAGSFDVIHASYQYPDGPQIHIHGGWSKAHIPFNAGYEAWFENGFVRLDPSREPGPMVYENPTSVEGKPASYEPGDAYYNEIAYFLDCVENDLPLLECPPASARDSLTLLDKEAESIRLDQVVSI